MIKHSAAIRRICVLAQVQQLGRTHRSNQQQPPLYYIVSSDICGQSPSPPPFCLRSGL